jgi:purine/pyrimidine-nucleoside phosphorylase
VFKINKYFNGDVVSIAFQTETLPATVGVMKAGQYDFGTTDKETMTVVSGKLKVKLPGSKDWQTYSVGEQFIVEANQNFVVKTAVETAYFCTYIKESKKKVLKK